MIYYLIITWAFCEYEYVGGSRLYGLDVPATDTDTASTPV